MSGRAPVAAETFIGASGNRLAADRFGAGARPVLLLHGGGQTRHAWKATAERIAGAGWSAYSVDQRGHGDSEWVADGLYAFSAFADDVAAISRAISATCGAVPVIIGASLGGIATLLAAGAAAKSGERLLVGLVLVDITPRVDLDGVARVRGFMRTHAEDGFATIDDAAAAVAAYLPHRERPRSHDGLKKNLRQGEDGRWRWHWDPRFIDGPRAVGAGDRLGVEAELINAAKSLTVPTLLVRGRQSELVRDDHAREFLALVPHAAYADVAGARHMVAGDRNDKFAAAIVGFLNSLAP